MVVGISMLACDPLAAGLGHTLPLQLSEESTKMAGCSEFTEVKSEC